MYIDMHIYIHMCVYLFEGLLGTRQGASAADRYKDD